MITKFLSVRNLCCMSFAATLAIASAGCRVQSLYATTRPVLAFDDLVKRFEVEPRLTVCDLHKRWNGSVEGVVEMPQHRDVLKAHGLDVSKVKLLPEETATGDRFALVTAEHALLRRSPRDEKGDRDNGTDVVKDEPVWILDRREGWTYVHSSDGYLGWVPSDAIKVVDAETFSAASTTRLVSIVTTKETDEKSLREAQASHARFTRELVISDARTFLGTRYVWGGKTRAGIDCSGLTQTAYSSQGILLPRDADQQSNVGRLVATRYQRDALLPGDLLFFVSAKRGNVHHVALYLGDGRYIEAAGRAVRIRSMIPGSEGYDAERTASFGWARRVIE